MKNINTLSIMMVLAIGAICTQQTLATSYTWPHVSVLLPSEASNEAKQNWNSSVGVTEGGVNQYIVPTNPRFQEHVFVSLPSQASNEAKQNWNSNTMEHNIKNNETNFNYSPITTNPV